MDNMFSKQDIATMGMGQGLGTLAGGLGSMMFGGNAKNPYDSASPYLNKIPGTISPYFNPYIQGGQSAYNTLQGQYGNLVNDPNAQFNKVAGGYHESPGYQWQLNQGMNAANNAAAAGGMTGTPQHQQQASTMAEGLANQDFYNYLSQVLGLYGTGMSGLNNMSNTGYNASDQMAGALSSNLLNQGNLAFSGQAAKNQAKGDQWGDIAGGLGSLAAFAFL